jgi:hypothetical protein
MHVYHPIRVDEVVRLRELRRDETTAELQKKMLSMLSNRYVGTKQLADDHSHRDRQRLEEGFDDDANAAWRSEILSEITAIKAAFEDRGRNIFDMSIIAGMFRHVDVDDLVIEDTPLPYPAIYMHFGEGASLYIGPETWIDGVYVAAENPELPKVELVFVCNHPGADRMEDVPLGVSYKILTSAVSTFVFRDRSVSESLAVAGLTGAPEICAASTVMVEAIRMAVNGILYLNIPTADVEYDYPESSPKELVLAARSENSSASKKATSRLNFLGYTRVNFCGRDMARSMHAVAASGNGEHAHVAPHWRRGHWRRVAFGSGRRERRWHLFAPTVVNAHLGAPSRGRIHIVTPRSNTD